MSNFFKLLLLLNISYVISGCDGPDFKKMATNYVLDNINVECGKILNPKSNTISFNCSLTNTLFDEKIITRYYYNFMPIFHGGLFVPILTASSQECVDVYCTSSKKDSKKHGFFYSGDLSTDCSEIHIEEYKKSLKRTASPFDLCILFDETTHRVYFKKGSNDNDKIWIKYLGKDYDI